MKKIFVTYDHDIEQYVWAETPHDLQVESRNWGHQYREAVATEKQFQKLKDGGWIIAVTSWGKIAVRI